MNKKVLEAVAVIVVAAVVFISCGRKDINVTGESVEESKDASVMIEHEELEVEDLVTEAPNIYVHVSGSVVNPGVYEVPEGTRVYEAVEAAGGFSKEADRDYVNLVEVLRDGEKVYIPSTDEILAGSVEADSGLVNINTATVEKLCTIPGIGETRAKAIVDYRSQYGNFATVEDLMNVSGIKEGTFNKIKDYIKV